MSETNQVTATAEPAASHAHEAKHAHAGTYVAVLGALAALTLVELVVVYLGEIRVPLLLIIAGAKAWLVLQFYMHMRYEGRLITYFFMIPLAAAAVLTAIMRLFAL